MVRWVARLVFAAAVAAWSWGVLLVLNGNTERGLAVGVPAASVLLAYAWRKGMLWLPDGCGGP